MCEKQRSATRHITAAIMDVAEIDGGQARIAMGHLEAAERALARKPLYIQNETLNFPPESDCEPDE